MIFRQLHSLWVVRFAVENCSENFSDEVQVVEDREEGDAEEETEGAAKVGHLKINQLNPFYCCIIILRYQGGERIYEVFCLNIGLLRHSPH